MRDRTPHPVVLLLAGVLAATFALQAEGAAGTDLGAGATLLPGGFEPGRQPDGNTLVFDGPEGLVVFDTGRHVAHSDAILALAKARAKPVVAIVNSHWHLDHVSGNRRLRAAFPALRVHASGAATGALRGFLADSRRQAEAFLATPGDAAMQAEVRGDVETIAAGDIVADEEITTSGERVLAGRPLQLGLAAGAATAGDVWAYDAASGVLAAGDLVTLPAPFLDTACPARWRAALAALEAVPFTTLVPGHGAPMDRAQFARWRGAFEALLDCAAGGGEAAACATAWREAVAPLDGDAGPPGITEYYVALLRNRERQALLCAGNGGA